jgi:hypothetical protein
MGREKLVKRREVVKMKTAVMVVLIASTLITASSAFAYWKCPAGIEVRDPAPCPFKETNY